MNFWNRMQNVDARAIYIFMMVAIAIPLVKPIGLPMRIMPTTLQVYDFIEKLPAGSKVYISFDYGPGQGPELNPMSTAVLNHFFRKGFKVYAMASITEGPMVAQQMLAPFEKQGKVYGKDFINLGFFAGGEAGLTALCQDIRKVIGRDFKGIPIDQIEMMKDVNKITDFALGVTVNSGPGGYGTPEVWVRQVPIVYKTPFVLALNAVMTPSSLPFLQAKQITGLLGGLRAAAEYELCLKQPGAGAALMDAQSAAHVVMIVFIILGNIAYFSLRSKRKPGGI